MAQANSRKFQGNKDLLAPGYQKQAQQQQSAAINPLRAFLQDPSMLQWHSQGTVQPTNTLNMYTLREMARACQPVAAILLTRQDQIALYAKRPAYNGDIGIQIKMRDKDEKAGPAAKKRIHELEEIILRCGRGPSMGSRKRPGLMHYLRMQVRDTLVIDGMATEKRPDRRDDLYDWWAVDVATIRHASPIYRPSVETANGFSATGYALLGDGYGGVKQPESAQIAFVQMIQNQPAASFTHEELSYWIRNPRTDLESNGYGYSELECLIETITGFLNGMTYNSKYFTAGNIPEGVLSLVGAYTKDQMDAFTRSWNAMVQGVANAHRIPFMAFKEGKGLDWVPMKSNNREMQFAEWLDFLTTLVCAIYRCDREEIGFGSKAKGEPGGLGADDNGTALAHSQSKGLHPLLQHVATGFNEDIVPGLDPSGEFYLTFAGMDAEQEDLKIERAIKLVTGGLSTPNDERAKLDMAPIAKDALWGDAPGSSTLYQAWSLGIEAQQQAEGMGDDPGTDAPEGDPMHAFPAIDAQGQESHDDPRQAPGPGDRPPLDKPPAANPMGSKP
jgi:hypothetical protein